MILKLLRILRKEKPDLIVLDKSNKIESFFLDTKVMFTPVYLKTLPDLINKILETKHSFEDVKEFVEKKSKVAGFAIDNFIARGSKINFRADIKEIEGKDIARRGRIPGAKISSRLDRIF